MIILFFFLRIRYCWQFNLRANSEFKKIHLNVKHIQTPNQLKILAENSLTKRIRLAIFARSKIYQQIIRSLCCSGWILNAFRDLWWMPTTGRHISRITWGCSAMMRGDFEISHNRPFSFISDMWFPVLMHATLLNRMEKMRFTG